MENLRGDLDGHVDLVLVLELDHEPDQGGGLVAGPAARAAEHGLGQLVLTELVHLAGQPDLGVGIEPQAKEPLRRLAGPIDVARPPRQPQRQLLAPLQHHVVERLDLIHQRQRVGIRALLLHELGQVQPQVGFRPRRGHDAGQFGDRFLFLVVPPEKRAERQPGVDRVGGTVCRAGLAAEVVDQVAEQVVALVHFIGCPQNRDHGAVKVVVHLGKGYADETRRAAAPDGCDGNVARAAERSVPGALGAGGGAGR
jgi:hypothetical protein